MLDRGDVNLTFKRYLADPVRLLIEDDHVVAIDGDSVDAELMRGYFAAWGDTAAYAVSHVGWGLNRRARWDAMSFYDKADFNGTELRAFAGNFLYSTGANEVAGRHTLGHFDLPLRALHGDAGRARRGRPGAPPVTLSFDRAGPRGRPGDPAARHRRWPGDLGRQRGRAGRGGS